MKSLKNILSLTILLLSNLSFTAHIIIENNYDGDVNNIPRGDEILSNPRIRVIPGERLFNDDFNKVAAQTQKIILSEQGRCGSITLTGESEVFHIYLTMTKQKNGETTQVLFPAYRGVVEKTNILKNILVKFDFDFDKMEPVIDIIQNYYPHIRSHSSNRDLCTQNTEQGDDEQSDSETDDKNIENILNKFSKPIKTIKKHQHNKATALKKFVYPRDLPLFNFLAELDALDRASFDRDNNNF